jgi:hypothetical protein
MRAFEVCLNGKKLCLAGIGDDGVLTAIVNWVKGRGGTDMFLQVGGLVSQVDEHVRWVNQKHLRVGDQIQIRVVEASAVDKPIERYRTDPKERLKAQKNYVRRMAKELGWKIQVRSKQSTS